MGVLVLFAWVVLATAVPDAAPHWLAIDRHAPDLFVAMVAYLALRSDGHGVVPWGIALGAAKDCVSIDPLGTHAFVLGTVAYVLARRRSSFDTTTGVSRALTVAGAVLLARVLYILRCLPLQLHGPSFSFSQLLDALPSALWTAVFSWPLMALLDGTGALDDVTGRRRGLSA